METIEIIISITGWIFGLISCICAVIQTIAKNKYKKLAIGNKGDTKIKGKAGDNSQLAQIGEININN